MGVHVNGNISVHLDDRGEPFGDVNAADLDVDDTCGVYCSSCGEPQATLAMFDPVTCGCVEDVHGYAVFEANGGPQLQRIDNVAKFADDDEALNQCLLDAGDGDTYALRCLREVANVRDNASSMAHMEGPL